MLLSPIEQFSIYPLINLEYNGMDFSFSNSSLSLLLVVLVILVLFYLASKDSRLVPTSYQTLGELVYEFISGLIEENIGSSGQKYFPLIFTIFTVMAFSNWLGLIPYNFTVTSHMVVNFCITGSIFMGVTLLGLSLHGLEFFGFFFPAGVPLVMSPFIIMIELLSYCIRPMSHSVSLFVNMWSGHALMKIMASFSWNLLTIGGMAYLVGFFPWMFVVVFTLLEVGMCCIQAYVFSILTVLYIRDAIFLH